MKIYLAGPVTGLDYKTARHGWREEFAELLGDHWSVLSPLRGQDHLRDMTSIFDVAGDPKTRAILHRCVDDVRRCDLVVANFSGATKVSIGSVLELGMALAWNKPIVTIVEPGMAHDHAFIREISVALVGSVTEAVDFAKWLGTPGI